MNKKILNKSLKLLNKCNGICKQCKELIIPSKNSESNNKIYYAFICGIGDKAGMNIMSSTLKNLKNETINGIEFELS